MQQTDLSAKHLVHKFNLETFANSVHEVEEVETIRHSKRFKNTFWKNFLGQASFMMGHRDDTVMAIWEEEQKELI